MTKLADDLLARLDSTAMTKANDLLNLIDSTLVALRGALVSQPRLTIVTNVLAVADSEVLDGYCAEAQDDLGSAVCLVTLLDDDHQTFPGTAGVDREDARPTGVNDSLCQYVVATGEPLRVDDASVHCSRTPGFNELSDDIHSYYGEPIHVSGEVVGAFCALDSQARHWSESDCTRVRTWADTVERWFQDALAG